MAWSSAPPLHVRFVEFLLAVFTFEVCCATVATLAVTVIVKYGIVAVLLSPLTALRFLHAFWRGLKFPQFVVFVNTTPDAVANRTADVVLKRAKDSDLDAGEVADAPVGRAVPAAPDGAVAAAVVDPAAAAAAPNAAAPAAQSQIRRR